METNTGYPHNYPHKLKSILEAPEQFSEALRSHLSATDALGLILYAPSASVVDRKVPATVLVVTDDGWLVASENQDGGSGISVEQCKFSDTLFLELTSIVLWGRLKIDFASTGTSYSAVIRFSTAEERLYREAIDLVLDGVDRTRASKSETDRGAAEMLKGWPLKLRNEVLDYLPKGQRLLAATQWPAILDGFRRELAPAGALLVTERELVVIADEKTPGWSHGEWAKYGGIITYFPLARLADFHVGQQDRFGVLALHVHARHGGERLEILFPSDHEQTISKAMERVRSLETMERDAAIAA
jgi:hypothetical protein